MTRHKLRAVLFAFVMVMSLFSIAGTGLSGAATTDSSNVIQGELTYADGENVSNWKVLASPGGTLDPPVDYTDSSGAFSVNVSTNDSYNVWYQQYNVNNAPSENFPRDGKVDMWALGTVNTSYDDDIGAETVPNGSLLKVKVVDSSGNPISNATVDISLKANGARASSGGVTNSKGQTVLNGTDLPGIEVTGQVAIDVRGPNQYGSNFSRISVSSNRTYTVVLYEEATVNGTVSAADGDPVVNDTVIYKNSDLRTYASAKTDGSGKYDLSVRSGYTYERAFYQGDKSQNGYQNAPADGVPDLYAVSATTVSADSTSNISLPEGHNVTIRVVRENGSGVSGANLYLYQNNDGSNAGAGFQTNASGEVTVELAGSLNVNVDPPSGSDLAGRYQELVADSDKTITITLPNTVTVSGNVTGSDGQSAPGYEVVYHTTQDPYASDRGQTGTTGSYAVEVPDNRTYHIDLTQEGADGVQSFADDGVPDIYAYGFASVGGTNETRDLTVPYGNDLNITVLGPDGNPVPDADVYVRHIKDDRSTGVSGFTNADGQFVIDGANKTGVEVNGTVHINVNAPSGSSLSDAFAEYTVTSNRSVTLQLDETVNVSGKIVDSSGTAVSGYRAEIQTFEDSKSGFDAITDENGTFTGQASQNGTFEYEFSQRTEYSKANYPKDGIPDVHPLGTVETGTSDVSLGTSQLPEGHLLNVTVVDPSGQPVENVEVNVQVRGTETSAFTWGSTNADGQLVLDGATEPGLEANGEIELNIDPQSSEFARTEVETTLTSNDSVRVELEPTFNITATVEQADGTPIAGDRLDAYDTTDSGAGGTTWTNESGFAALPVGESGEYNVGFVQVQTKGDYQPHYPADGVPDIYAVGHANNSSADFGTVTLPEAHNLTVSVVDTEGNAVDARVYFNHENNGANYGRSRLTGSNGTTAVEMVGNIDIYVNPEDSAYRSNSTRINLTSDQTIEIVVSKGAPITGQVKNPDGTNATGWHVDAFGQGGGGDVTGDDGRFTIRVEPGQTYDLAYKQTDFDGTGEFPKDGIPDLYAFEAVTVDSSGVDVGTKQLPPGHLLNVTVVNENGTALSGMELDIQPVNGEVTGHHGAYTNDQGQVVLDGASAPGIEANGTLRIHVEGTDVYSDVHREVTVTNNSSIEIVMKEPAQVSGRIVYPDNTTQANDTVVHFGSETSDSILRITQTDAEGKFNFSAPRADDVDITFYQFDQVTDGDRFFPRDGVVDIYAVKQVDTTGGDVNLGNETLPEGHVVNVTVYDESGDPVRNATVSVSHRQGGFNNSAEYDYADGGYNSRTDPDGQLHYGGLLNRNYTTPPGVEVAGNVSIRVSPPEGDDRFVDETYTRNITVDSKRNLSFKLEEKNRVSGQFVDSNGDPTPGGAFSIVTGNNTFEIDPPSENSTFSVTVSEAGNYTLNYAQSNGSGGFLPRDNVTDLYATNEVTIDGNVDVGKQTIPDAAGVLDVRVVDENGTAVENATVSIEVNQTGTGGVGFVRPTDEQGYFTNEAGQRGIELNGSYIIEVEPPENSTRFENTTYTRNVTITGDTTETFTLQPNVSTGPSASGQVQQPDGTPAENARVAFNLGTWKIVQTDANGNYSATLPQNDTYEIFIAQWGEELPMPRDGIVDIYDAGTYNISGPTKIPTTTLPKGYVLDVKVVDQNGDPVEKANVTYHPNNTKTGWLMYTNANGFVAPLEDNRSITGVEVLGNVTVDVKPPSNSSQYVNETVTRNVTVTENDTLQVTLTKKEPNISVDYSVESTEVTPGNPINVSATVTNTGSANGTENVTLTIENSTDIAVETTKQVTLAPGESTTVSFSDTVPEGDWLVSVNDLSKTAVNVRPGVSVTVDAPKQMGVGQNETVYVTVSSVSNGVGTLDLNVSVANGSVVEITEATTTIGGADNSSVGSATEARLDAYAGDTNDTGNVTVAKVVINASNVGTTKVRVSGVRSVGDEDATQYTVKSTGEDSVDVVPVPVVGNYSLNPTDTDGDGKFEDVNGDREFTLEDINALFQNSDGEVVNEYGKAFDFNGNGEFDIVDVQALYNELNNGGS